jgi:hypothetical protein
MGTLTNYRAAAAEHRAAAMRETLANRRTMHERAARLCEEMADRAERAVYLAGERLAAKAQREEAARAREHRRRLAGLPARA